MPTATSVAAASIPRPHSACAWPVPSTGHGSCRPSWFSWPTVLWVALASNLPSATWWPCPIRHPTTVPLIAEGVAVPAAFLLEVIGTFLLVNSILHCAVRGTAGNLAPIAIGFTVGACIVAFGPLTGASFNPARTLGPAVATGIYTDIWLYMAATFGGAALASLYNRRLMLSAVGEAEDARGGRGTRRRPRGQRP